MSKVLGLDLGTNSIGWAIIDNEMKKIIKTGVRVFPEGINRDNKGAEISKNQLRREARQARRNKFRKKLRKKILISELKKQKMYPETPEELNKWIIINPYILRAKALSEKLSLLEIGRILYHLNQRRGFKSSRKSIVDKKEEGKFFTSDGKTGIDETNRHLQEGFETLGQYLSTILPQNKPYKNLPRIRNRHTSRDMYVHEFNKIWECQSVYYPDILNNDLRQKIGDEKEGILFFQRPLKSQKYLIGKCTFEKDKPRCPESAIPFELFRMYSFINTIQVISPYGEEIKLDNEQKNKLVDLFNSKENFEFKAIVKSLGFSDAYHFNYDMEHEVVGNHTISSFIKVFGKKQWDSFTDKEKEDIWHNVFSAEDNEWLAGEEKDDKKNHNWAERIKNWNLNEKQIKALTGIKLKKDYASLSRKAINNILPFLKAGFRYSDAVLLGGVRNAFGKQWNDFTEQTIITIQKDIIDIARKNRQGNSLEKIKKYLSDNFNFNEKQFKKLYHHSNPEDMDAPVLENLPEPENLRNPIVQQALYELRNLINAIIDEYGKPDEIRVELARELKSSRKKREEILKANRERERENDRIKKELDKLKLEHSRENIQKYILWEECKHTCPYTGDEINVNDLFFSGRYQIEHIIPWSVSLNDSMNNKTLCEVNENRAKGDRTPYQFYGGNKEKWEEIKLRVSKLLPPNKYRTFIREADNALDDFISRQLNDTRYISRKAKEYLSKVCKKTYVTTGMLTSELRHYWGLNSILNPENDVKSRDDHRHHAIDAIVVATTNNSHLKELSKWNKYQKIKDGIHNHHFREPWEGFFEDAKKSVLSILVSHKNRHRILTTRQYRCKKNGIVYTNKGISARGALHEETIYGKRKDLNGQIFYAVRKPLDKLTPAMITNKIVDYKVRMLIWERVRKFGIDPTTKFEKPKELFKEPIYLPNKHGEPVPIKKVRIRENFSNILPLKKDVNQWVESGNNFLVGIYEDVNGNKFEEIVTFFEAARRKQAKKPIIEPIKQDCCKLIVTLQINDLFLLGIKDITIDWNSPDYNLIRKHLYRVQKISSMYYTFRLHSASTIKNKTEEIYIQSFKRWDELFPIKVKLSTTGILQRTI